jgi:hypothetical protein
MSCPVLFVIDDGAGVVRSLREDLGRRFGEDIQVIGESSAAAGLAMLRELTREHARVALLIVDHDMSQMSGVGFLACAHELHPPSATTRCGAQPCAHIPRSPRASRRAFATAALCEFDPRAVSWAFAYPAGRGNEHGSQAGEGATISTTGSVATG